jgi:hypothetical protein
MRSVLMHRRSGRVGMCTLAKMSQHDSVLNLTSPEMFTAEHRNQSVCGACKEGGQKASPLQHAPVPPKIVQPYTKVHINIAGPRKGSLGESQCFTVMRCEAPGFVQYNTNGANADLL